MMVNSTLQHFPSLIPFLFAPHAALNKRSVALDRSLTATSAAKRDAARRALIVDDAADITEMLAVFFACAGFEVVTADCAAAALAAARESEFDVIISDIGMPDMNGYELAKSLRQLAGYEATPMIALTGYSEYDDRDKSLQAGFNAHVTKPLDPDLLWELLGTL